MRALLKDTFAIKQEVESIKKKPSDQGENIELVFSYLLAFINKKETTRPKVKIGYKK